MGEAVLAGVRIVDLSEQVPGPYATRLLAGLGADVIKVERPDSGDRLRHRPVMFEAENRGKRDLSIDLKAPEGRAALLRVIASADVLVEGFRPGVMERLGLGFEALTETNPKLIYLSISGYGADGPYRDLPGHDFQYLAYAGAIPSPQLYFAADYVPTTLPVADMGTSVYSVLAVVLALLEKQRDPHSFTARHLDIGMSDCTLALMEPRIAEALSETSTAAALVRPGYGVYATADSHYVSIGALEDHFWKRLVDALGLDDLTHEKFAAYQDRRRLIDQIEKPLRERVAEFTRDALIELLIRHDVPVAPVNDLHEAARDPHFRARGMVYDVPGDERPRVAEWPVALDCFADRGRLTPTPALGQHSRDVLAEYGFGDVEIDGLIAAGIVRQANTTPDH
ncbi:CaiB/BaiF CoA transferase family protein [Streptomyces sp. NPDC056653]|uniref:CaiB/BaiF CoA transferase family protein n=1 Tax=Streptomyces sp. NPDC056653 TaxID=3345894 RepID=UPI0036820D0E